MIKEAQNKMIKQERTKGDLEQSFFFPDYQLTITAPSLEEAQVKLTAILKSRAK
jgi:hypothetical protein